MAITRSKNTVSQIKNESSQDSDTYRMLHSTSNTTTGRVNKRKPAPRASRSQAAASVPKKKNNNNNNSSSKPSNMTLTERRVTDEKIRKLIHYVEHDKMTIKDAREKANLGSSAACKYYGLYRDDPNHNIPTLGKDVRRGKGYFTYEKIKALIDSIIHDKLTIEEAAKKANMHNKTVMSYYSKYMMDPEHKIPIRGTMINKNCNITYTQEQIKELIDYVNNDHLTVREAAKKLNMGESSAYRYYNKYKNNPEKKIPSPYHGRTTPKTTSDQVRKLISYIVDDKMSLKNAAIKSDISYNCANTYYARYLRDPKHQIPIPGKTKYNLHKRCNQEDVEKIIGYIVNDNMNATDAARKMGVAPDTARNYYRKYLSDPDRKIPLVRKLGAGTRIFCTADQIKTMIGYIVDDKMSMAQAAREVNIDRNHARRYYKQYMEDPNHAIPIPGRRKAKSPTPDQVKQFLGYILDDNMTVIDAGKKAGLRYHTRYIYYKIYKDDPLRAHTRPNVDEQARQLVGYVNDDKMTIKAASEKLKISRSAGHKLYKECKDGVENRPLNQIDIHYEILKAIADVYKKYHKME